jgi:two-component system, LytTR family, sensor kinase
LRRTEGFERQTEDARPHLWARMQIMLRRDDLGFPTFWTVQIAGWGCFYLWGLISLVPFLRQPGALRGNTAFFVSLFAASSLLRPVCRSLIGRAFSWIALEMRAFVWSLPAGATAGYVIERVTTLDRPLSWAGWLANAVQSTFILFVWCSLYFSIKLWQKSLRERERLLRAEAEVRNARLSALRYQLNPHFLFNSLNAVSTLVLEGNPPAATRMLAQIGEFLRSILDSKGVPETTLHQEIVVAEQYLAIEQTRLGPRLRVDMAISPETLDALVPSMLLQPLIENAVRHGVAPVMEGGTIRIESELYGTRLQIKVQNSGPASFRPPVPNGSPNGIGISNTAERLRTLYAANYKFVLQWPETGGCEVTVELPCRKIVQPQGAAWCAR